MDRKPITTIVERTRSLLRFYCSCGELAVTRRDEAGKDWECPGCGEARKIPVNSEVELPVQLDDLPMILSEESEAAFRLDPDVHQLGERLKVALRKDNLAAGSSVVKEYYCLKVHMSEDIRDVLLMTSIESEGTNYLHLSTHVGRMTAAEQALKLIQYTTHYSKVHLEDRLVTLKWFLPLRCVDDPLLYEVALSMLYHTSIIRTTILGPRPKSGRFQRHGRRNGL